jgi:hypothetical protein
MRTITYQEAYDALKETVEAYPDRQVTECRYVDRRNQPLCVVGVVLDKLRIPLPEYHAIANHASITANFSDQETMLGFLKEKGIALEDSALGLLNNAQEIQDSAADNSGNHAAADHPGRPWRDILTEVL